MTRPSWMPVDDVAIRTRQLLQLMEAWRPAEEARRAAEADRLAALWAGIEAGDVVELTVDATVSRGGLRIYTVDGEIRRAQVNVVEIDGEMAMCRRLMGWRGGPVNVMEWIARGEIEGVGEEGLAVINESSARQYWS